MCECGGCRLEKQQSMSAQRKTLVGSGDRSERIRTYNFPQASRVCETSDCKQHAYSLHELTLTTPVLSMQGRVTDHRIGVTEHGIDAIMNGENLDTFFDALRLQNQAELLSHLNS